MLALVLALLQAPQAPAIPAAEAEVPSVAPYAGTLREGRLELARLSKAEHHDEAQSIADALLAKKDFDAAPESERAQTHYAIGVAAGRADDLERAIESFHRARGLAGSSALGLDAAYNAGTHLAMGAEELRLRIPEIREKLKLPPLQQPAGSAQALVAPQGPGGGEPKPPDALEVARNAYLAARGELALGWRETSGDGDTRANLELIQRRLRELDELKRQREEQQKQDEEQQKKDPNSQKKPGEDPNSKEDPGQDPSKDPSQDPQQPKDSKEPKQDAKDEPQEPDPKDPQQPPPQDAQQDPQRQEMLMTPEEMQRLLDQLKSIEDQARQVEALLRERRRTPVKKDW